LFAEENFGESRLAVFPELDAVLGRELANAPSSLARDASSSRRNDERWFSMRIDFFAAPKESASVPGCPTDVSRFASEAVCPLGNPS
jgi:hypothetical protein